MVDTMLYAVALVIYNDDRSKFLIAKRPSDTDTCPNMWGLIAGYVDDYESFEEAAIRAGIQKLGVALAPVDFIGRMNLKRKNDVLHMEEYEARIIEGIPKVPQGVRGVTQYTELRWGTDDDLFVAAREGSLCSRIYFSSLGKKW